MGAESPEQGRRMYAAFTRLVELIESIVLRSSRDAWQLPLLSLVSRPGAESPLTVLAHVFVGDDRRVPHVKISATGQELRTLLHEAYVGLSTGAFGTERLRFQHYALVDGLMQTDLSGVPANRRRRELARQLRHNIGQRASHDNNAPPVPDGWAGLLLWLAVYLLPGVMFRLLAAGWPFGDGRRFRWFMHQRYLAPRLSGDFFTFASRLTVNARDQEDPEQVDKLLVHAFLHDLRVQYRRRLWRLRPWRRTSYPVILLDDIAPDNGGYALVKLVNAVRVETGQSDPLLAITNGDTVPPDGLDPADPAVAGRLVPIDGLDAAFRAWRAELPRARRSRRATTWILAVEVPPADLVPYRPLLPRIVPAKPPWLARPALLAGLVLCLVAAFGIWKLPGQYDRYRANCEWPPSRSGGLVETQVRGGQCIGYSDHDRQVFSKDPSLTAIQRIIFRQNREAENAWRGKRSQPFVTLVYFGSLTEPDRVTGEETFAGEREELQGMAAAQFRAFEEAKSDRTSASPFLRIVIANAGPEMEYSAEVVRMLTTLARRDPTVLGVIGLVESRTAVREAIQDLGELNLPVLAPTLSGGSVLRGDWTDQVRRQRHRTGQTPDAALRAEPQAGVPLA